MNRTLFTLITSIGKYLVLMGCFGIFSVTHLQAQTVDETKGIFKAPIHTDHSVISWKGTEMRQSGKHEGTVDFSEGYLLLQKGKITGGHFVADMNSIAITDIPEHEPVPRKRLRNHLLSNDFFLVEKYPTAEFKITKTESLGTDSTRVWGDLTIRDVTKSISFMAFLKSDQKSVLEMNTSFTIDRYEWNISYQGSYWKKLTSLLDNTLVDADIFLTIEITALLNEGR